MKRFALIAAMGLFALALSACGEHGQNKPTTTDHTAPQQTTPGPQQPTQDGQVQE